MSTPNVYISVIKLILYRVTEQFEGKICPTMEDLPECRIQESINRQNFNGKAEPISPLFLELQSILRDGALL